MSTPIRVLILEDRAADAELMLHELRKAGFDPDWQRVEAEPEYLRALETNPDLILADWSLPQFSGQRALQLMTEGGLDIPFIIVSGSIGEEAAVEAMRQGANDYLLKDRPARLGGAVRRALDDKQLRDERRLAESQREAALEALRESEERFRGLFESATIGMYRTTPDGRILMANPALVRMLGYQSFEELAQRNLTEEFYWPMYPRQDFKKRIEQNGEVRDLESAWKRKDGSAVFVRESARLGRDEKDQPLYYEGTVEDITERKQAEEEIQSLARFPSENPGPILRIALDGTLLYINPIGLSLLPEWHLQAGQAAHPILHEAALQTIDKETTQVVDLEYGERVYSFHITPIVAAGYANFYGIDITERKQAEAALLQAEKDYRSLFENVPDGVYRSTPDGKFLSVNPALVKLFGYSSAEELRGADIGRDLFVNPEARQILANTLLQKGELHNAESTMHRKDGQQISVLENTLLIRDGQGKALYFEGTLTDITERKQAEENLRDSEARYRALFQGTAEGILIADIESRMFMYANPAICRLLGYSEAELQTMGVSDIHPKADLPAVLAEFEAMASGDKTLAAGIPCLRKDGTIIYVDVSAIAMSIDDKASNVGFFRDITERKQKEEEIRQLNANLEQRVEERTRELRQAQEQLVRSEKLAILGQLAGGVGHELRNPLSVINTSIYYLKMVQPEASDKIKEHHFMIEQEVHNADKIISDLLDYARVISSDRKPVSASKLVRQTMKRFSVPPTVKLNLELPDDIPDIYADPRQAEQVLSNLVTNACQAMNQEGRLTISARLEKKMVRIAVKDTGTGISPENMKKLFEPLFTTKAKGIGLGLAVSQKMAEANGGRIEVESEMGKGSTFTLYLPVKRTKSVGQ